MNMRELHEYIGQIKDALNTEENGEALVEVARNAHKAEQDLASLKHKLTEEFENDAEHTKYGPNAAMRVMSIVRGEI